MLKKNIENEHYLYTSGLFLFMFTPFFKKNS